MRSITELNALEPASFAAQVGHLFEGAPSFLGRLAEARPFESDEDLFDSARIVARWDADPDGREAIDGEIRRAAAELFGPPDEALEAAKG